MQYCNVAIPVSENSEHCMRQQLTGTEQGIPQGRSVESVAVLCITCVNRT